MRNLLLVLLLLLWQMTEVRAQEVAVKANLLYAGVAQTPNLGMEVRLDKRWTLDLSGGYNWFNLKGTADNNKKMVHWLVMPELRYWVCEPFNGHFFGAHLLGAQYNVSQHKVPMMFDADSQKYRYEGWAAGAGVSYGYQLPLAKRWNLEFSLGVGYAYMKYDKFLCPKCGSKEASGVVKHYFGPTKATIGLIYIIK